MRSTIRTATATAASGWAAALPLLCAAHCVLAPLLVLAAPALALSEGSEALAKGASAVLAAGVVAAGVRLHRRAVVAVPVAAGIGVWAFAVTLHDVAALERLWTAAGGVLLAGGMVWNAQLRHAATCRSCGCGAHR
jgi:drug/metabolite transporter superfamily protein YnfA